MSRTLRPLVALAVAAAVVLPTPVARAQDDGKGAKSAPAASGKLAQAAAAWDNLDLTSAVPLYEKALDEGGLFPADVIVAYSRIGTVKAAMGKKDAALSAFRVAASLDPNFQLPAESGPKAKPLFEQARKEAQQRGGKLTVTSEVPEKVDAGDSFTVKGKLAEAFAPLVDKVGVEVKDTLGKGVAYQEAKGADAVVSFEIPAKVAIGGTTLLVRISALDPHGNRWAMQETRVKVGPAAAPAVATGPTPEGSEDEDDENKPKKSSKSFFATPWPYVIGGVIVAGAVTAFILTRPSDHATVGAPAWH